MGLCSVFLSINANHVGNSISKIQLEEAVKNLIITSHADHMPPNKRKVNYVLYTRFSKKYLYLSKNMLF